MSSVLWGSVMTCFVRLATNMIIKYLQGKSLSYSEFSIFPDVEVSPNVS